MSYTKYKVAGKDVGIKFGYSAFKLVTSTKNKGLLVNEEGEMSSSAITKIILAGYQNNCLNKDIEADFLFDDFLKQVDEDLSTDVGREVLKAILETWTESTDIQKLVKDSDEKKSPTIQPDPTTLTESNNLPSESLESDPGKLEDTPSES